MSKPKILIIEDNPTTCKMFRIALQSENYEVSTAADGTTALRLAAEIKPDLILQDLVLPDMDGFELNEKLRQLPAIENIPIIALSGFLSKMEEAQRDEISGFTAFLLKPVELTHLFSTIRDYLPLGSGPKPCNNGKKILLVDDNATQLKLLKIRLMHAGFLVTTAVDGSDALRMLTENRPDAVISDILMPKVDGYELCLQIRQNPEFANIPVILLTSHYLEDEDKILGRKVAANYYLTRSPSALELIEKLGDCLKTKSVPLVKVDTALAREQHTYRIIRQLERQIYMNTGLAQRCSLQGAQLSLLGGVVESLSRNDNSEQSAFKNILWSCLDAAGISKGVLYLFDNDQALALAQVIGYSDQETTTLDRFLNENNLLMSIFSKKEIVSVPSRVLSKENEADILQKAKVSTCLFIPLVSATMNFGLLFLGSTITNVTEKDPLVFAHALANQLSQAAALSLAFSRLVDSESRYRTLMDNASCAIFICDYLGKILEINKKAELLLESSKKKITGVSIENFVADTSKAYFLMALDKLIKGSPIDPFEVAVRPLSAELKTVELSAVIVAISDKNLLLLVANDISEKRILQTQAVISDRLTTVGILAAGIAHEINNPVAWVLSNFEYLKNMLYSLKHTLNFIDIKTKKLNGNGRKTEESFSRESLDNSFVEIDDIIVESISGVERIRDIVRDLKGFSRISDNEISEVNVHEVLNSVINMSLSSFKYKARIEKKFAKKLPAIFANNGEVHQVFLNIVINAANAIEEGNLDANKIMVCSSVGDGFVKVDITDTGQGIEPAIISKIFDPFFTTKPPGSGTGLGLSICLKIITKMGGKITVESALGKGTTFSILLPIGEPKVKVESCAFVEKQPVTACNVLVIDDEPFMLKSMQRTLEGSHITTTALGGKAGLEILEQNPYDFSVIICDLSMPEVNGKDVYLTIKNKYPGLEQKIVFITGGAYTAELKEFIETSSARVLDKPFSRHDLLMTMDEVINENE